ncbi:MAG: hypothetical protein EPO02_09230 [Nitrospirae bacterium]|nr:MAG: hypothetical protein EPO02_09230 [Nitrospirota bacterium]
MRRCIRWAFVLLVLTPIAVDAADSSVTVKMTTSEGLLVPLLPEDLSGMSSRPLVKTRDVLDKKFAKGFFYLNRVKAKVGTELVGEYEVVTVPCRLTVYEISKRPGSSRELRVVATGYHAKPEKAVFRKTVEKLEENVFFVTAEKIASADDLNSHLRYMQEQGNAIVLKGYGTNWNLSALKLEMAGKDAKQKEKDDVFEKDALWLVDQLKNPLWLMSIRLETE